MKCIDSIVLNAYIIKNAIYKFRKYGNASFVMRFKCLIYGAVHVLYACYTAVANRTMLCTMLGVYVVLFAVIQIFI